jgi:hypothetical protein
MQFLWGSTICYSMYNVSDEKVFLFLKEKVLAKLHFLHIGIGDQESAHQMLKNKKIIKFWTNLLYSYTLCVIVS